MVDAPVQSVSMPQTVRVQTQASPEIFSGKRIALAHDWLVAMRGGERVLDRIAALTNATELYTMVHDDEAIFTPTIDSMRIHTSALQSMPGGATYARRWYLPLYPWAVSTLRIPANFDLLISTSSAMIKAIKPPSGTDGRPIPHICYCHTPPRYLWSMPDQYAVGKAGLLRRAALAVAAPRLRRYDKRTCNRVTRFLANSTHTADTIARCYGLSADIVFPPVDVERFTPDADVPRQDHFLVVSALEPYKRIDIAIRAAQQANVNLRIAGTGSQFQFLRSIAGPETTFLGQLDGQALVQEFRSAQALLFPGVEDFGITPVEAMATGCPVIAQHAGGALDWMQPRCGLWFEGDQPQSLAKAINLLRKAPESVDPTACRINAMRFTTDVFDARLCEVVSDVLEDSHGLQK